jgi:tetratricopeptide (TPR) repeat protein
MKRDSLAYAVAGTFFGILMGWILGSQQVRPGTPAAAAATTAAAPASTTPTANPNAPPLDTQKAADLERTAKAQPTNEPVRVELADLYYDAQRFDLATPWYEAALKINPRDIDVSTDLAVCYYYTNQVDRALSQFDYSLNIDPRHAKTLLNQGIVLAFGKQDLKGAAASWEKVVADAPGTPEAQKAQQALDGLKSAHPGMSGGGSGGTTGGTRP